MKKIIENIKVIKVKKMIRKQAKNLSIVKLYILVELGLKKRDIKF